MAFYEYRQNNSGGGFDFDDEAGIAQYVIVEADSARQADAKAQDIGLYFDGIESGSDCSCCGDRWYEQYNSWTEEEGTPTPTLGGMSIEQYMNERWFYNWRKDDGPVVYVHYKDGTVAGFNAPEGSGSIG